MRCCKLPSVAGSVAAKVSSTAGREPSARLMLDLVEWRKAVLDEEVANLVIGRTGFEIAQ
jgi:hypothetical protein